MRYPPNTLPKKFCIPLWYELKVTMNKLYACLFIIIFMMYTASFAKKVLDKLSKNGFVAWSWVMENATQIFM